MDSGHPPGRRFGIYEPTIIPKVVALNRLIFGFTCLASLGVLWPVAAHANEVDALSHAARDFPLRTPTPAAEEEPPSNRPLASSYTPPAYENRFEELPFDSGERLFSGTERWGELFFEVGAFRGAGGVVAAPGAAVVNTGGMRFMENDGFIGKLVALALFSQDSDVQSGLHTSTRTEYVGSGVYRVTKTSRYVSDEEAAAHNAWADEYNERLRNGRIRTEVNVYSPTLFGLDSSFDGARGWNVKLGRMFYESWFSGSELPGYFYFAANFAYVTAPARWREQREDDGGRIGYTNMGFTFEGIVPLTRFLDSFITFDANILSLAPIFGSKPKRHQRYTSPLSAGLYIHATDRVYGRAQAILSGFGVTDGQLSAQFEAGVRF